MQLLLLRYACMLVQAVTGKSHDDLPATVC